MHDANVLTPIDLAESCLKLREEFLSKCGGIPPNGNAMLPSEILAFMAACRRAKVDQVIESGRSYGYSTRCLIAMGFPLKSFEVLPVFSEDDKIRQEYPPSKYQNVELIHAPCPMVLSQKTRFGLLLDGPKGLNALNLANASNPAVVGIHDCHEGSPIRPQIDYLQWVTTDRLDPIPELDAQHLAWRGYNNRDVLKESFVMAVAQFIR